MPLIRHDPAVAIKVLEQGLARLPPMDQDYDVLQERLQTLLEPSPMRGP